ncbi:hypothetical protein T484DRAFT_1911210, partial [Baffinella frigidus]
MLAADRTWITIAEVLVHGSAGASMQVFPGDELVSIGGIETKGLQVAEVAQMLGGEEGTVIGLGIKPRCPGAVAREVRLTRRRLASSVGVPGGGQDANGERVRGPSGGGEAAEEKTGLERVLEYHRGHSQEYVNRLREATAIPSVSLEPEQR